METAILDEDSDTPRRPVLSQTVLAFLERKIILRELPPGAKLVEEELCERYGISRSPVREALRLLEGTGLVIRRPRQGVRVAPMSLADLDQIYSCRVKLEALAAEGAARSANPVAVAGELSVALAAMRSALEAGEVERCFDANVALTEALHEASGNAVLQRLLAIVQKPALRYRHLAYGVSAEMTAIAIEANQQMIDAIRRADAPAAGRVTAGLVEAAWQIVRTALSTTIGRR